jgi:DNA polymerase-3 subunit delta
MLDGLRAEDVPAPVVLWALAREIRTLARLARVQEQGQPLERAFAELRVWDKRKPLVRQGLQRFGSRQWRGLLRGCARIDRIIKGREPGADPWEALRRLTAHMAGLPSLGQS